MRPMTITEKILAKHAGLKEVSPGLRINARVDIALGNDITAPIAIKEFRKAGAKKVFHKGKVVLVPDHFPPNKDIKSAEQVKILREFAREQGLKYYFEGGEVGVEHALLPEKGIVVPGGAGIGAGSPTCTDGALYRAMDFTGTPIEKLSMDSRMAMCNMAIEAGAKSGIIAPDATTEAYMKNRAQRPHKC